MAYIQPTTAEFKAFFDRDFDFATEQATETSVGDLSRVRDRDIERAYIEANANFNVALFVSQAQYAQAFLYLSAHYLCHDMASAQEGLSSKFTWLAAQRSVGDVFEGYFVPDMVKKSPWAMFITSTKYGAKYYSLVKPLMIGNIIAIEGMTQI